MFCSNCGKKFEGNFCPFCGAQAYDLQKGHNGGDGTETKESGSKILREAYHESKMARLKWMFIGMFLVAIIAFPMGYCICDSGNIGNAMVDKKGRIKESSVDYRQYHIGVDWYFYLVLG